MALLEVRQMVTTDITTAENEYAYISGQNAPSKILPSYEISKWTSERLTRLRKQISWQGQVGGIVVLFPLIGKL
jgi:hypothetical protein